MSTKLFAKGLSIILALTLVLGAFAFVPTQAVLADAGGVGPGLQAGADRLTALQNNDGGWDWPLDNGNPDSGSAANIIGPIAKGLALAYLHTGDADHLAALQKAGQYLLNKTTVFSPSDGYLAAQLDEIFGGSVYTDHVTTNFYDKLAVGEYDRDGILYDTAGYIARIRTNRSGSQANMAAWDIGMGLVGAAACSADTGPWIEGVKAEINELDGANYYDVIGLAGALYGLAYVDEEFDPAAGQHTDAANLADLAEILASYQINNGGFAWNSSYVIADDYNEAIQETAYAVLALNEVDRGLYLNQVQGAADFLLDVQLTTGGWENYFSYGENNEVTAEALWAIAVAYPYPNFWVCPDGNCGHDGAQYATIQAAIDAAPEGSIVYVAAGSYDEDLSVNKPVSLVGDGQNSSIIGKMTITASDIEISGFTFSNPGQSGAIVLKSTASNVSIAGNRFTDIGVGSGNTSDVQGIYLERGPDNVTIDGNHFSNIYAGTRSVKAVYIGDTVATDTSDTIIVRNNTFENLSSEGAGGYGVISNNSAGTNGFQVINNSFANISGAWTTAVGLEGPTSNALVQGNTFSSLTGTTYGASAVLFQDNPVGDTVKIEKNQFNGSDFAGVFIHPDDEGDYTVNASPNWWGSMAGPGIDQAYGDVVTSPWCGDAACTFTLPDENGVVELSGNINVPGGIVIDQPGLTYLLKDGTVIQNDSPCFVVNASNTHILAESTGGATCVPTGGSAGIEVAAGLSELYVVGLEFDGSLTTGSAMDFAGDVAGIQIVDNYVHDFAASGLIFGGAVNGTHIIQGNLFQNVASPAIDSGVALTAEYNAWGSNVEPAMPNIDANPWTHVELYLESSGTPWSDQVVSGDTISYTVYADLQNLRAADFTLTYDAALLGTPEISEIHTDFSSINPDDSDVSVVDTSISGLIRFAGQVNTTNMLSGNSVALFKVSFTPDGDGALAFDAAADSFAMSPASGPSTNIYAATLTGASVNVIDLPSMSSENIAGYYLAGVPQEFQVTTTNPTTGGDFSNVRFDFTIAGAQLDDIDRIEYQVGTDWLTITNLVEDAGNVTGYFGPESGFPMGPDYTATTNLRVTFNTPGSYGFDVDLVDLGAGFVLANLSDTADVYAQPTISSADIDGPFLTGVEQEFQVTLTNPDDGGNFDHVLVRFTLENADPADIASIQYLDVNDGLYKDLPLYQDGTSLVGDYGPTTGFPMPAPYAATSTFKVTFAGDVNTSYDVRMELFDLDKDPDKLLASFSAVADVYANYSVNGTVSMQGRTFRGGVEMSLIGTTPYSPYTSTSLDLLSTNLSFANVAAGTYTITTNQPRYLNVLGVYTNASGEDIDYTVSIDVFANVTLPALELKGGNANNDDRISVGDAGVIGGDYGLTGDYDGDVNFSGKVDIFDLALVGGNYGLTSSYYQTNWLTP